MPSRKISELTALTAPTSADVLPIVDVSEASPDSQNKKITYAELLSSAPAGTAAAPAFAFDGDSDTGIYVSAANELSVTTGGTERLRIDATGQIEAVSLGTAAAPTYTFTGDPNTGFYSPGADQVSFATGGTQRLTVDTVATTSTLPIIHPLGGAGAPSVAFTGDLNTGIYSPGADQVAISTGGTGRMLVDASGRVVIGTTSANGPGLLQVNGGYNILKGFNRRPPLHRNSLFYKTSSTEISIVADCALNGYFYQNATPLTMPGSFTNNTDYAIWQHPTTGNLVADASFTTAPAGATGGSVVGGFHYIPSGRPTAFDNGSPTAAAEILEYSLWDLTWRPSCSDPRGMVCIEGGFWIDLYLTGATSYAGTTFSAVPSSKIGLTIADSSSAPLVPAQFGGNGSTTYGGFSWYEASEMSRSFGKKLPTYDQFSAAAYGAPEASSRGSDPGTVQWERVSLFGLAQATGTMWQWAQETCTAESPTAWQTGITIGRGDVYGSQTRALFIGGSWDNSSNSGSRSAFWNAAPWNTYANVGARFAAGHLVLG
jgi:hypothetical protein